MAESELRKFQAMLRTGDARVRRHEKSIRGLGSAFRHTVVTLGLFREAAHTAWMMTGNLAAGIVKTAAEFERLGVLLEGMADGATQIEKAADAQKQFNQIMEEAKTAPFTIKELTNSWVKFKSVGLDPADGSMRALVDAVAAFGGTDDILHRATIAVQQMAGKGVISMEELRQQMGEAVPQAMVLLAKGMNLTVGEMVDAISKGTVEAKPALEKLFNEFELAFGGRSQRLMETFTGSVARLNTNWQLALKEMGENSGLLEESKRIVNDLIIVLNDPAWRRFGIDVAVSFRQMLLALEQFTIKAVEFWGKYGEQIKLAAKLLVTIKVAMIAASKAAALWTAAMKIGIIAAFIKRLSELNVVMMVTTSNTKAATLAMRAFTLANPVLMLVGAAAALVTWFTVFKENEDVVPTATEDLNKYLTAIDPERMAEAKVELQQLKDEFTKKVAGKDGFQERLKTIQENIDVMKEAMQNPLLDDAGRAGFEQTIKNLEADRQRVIEQMEEMSAEITLLSTQIISVEARQHAEAIQRAKLAMGKAWDGFLEEALEKRRAAEKESDAIFDNDKDTKARLDRRIDIMRQFERDMTETFLKIANEQQAVIDAADKALEKDPTDEVWKERKDAAIQFWRQYALIYAEGRKEVQEQIEAFARENSFIGGKDGKKLEEQTKKLEQLLTSTRGRLAAVTAKLKEGQPELEKFKEGILKDFGPEDTWPEPVKKAVEQLLPLLAELDKANSDLKQKMANDAAFKSLNKTLAQTSEEAAIFAEAVESGLTEVPNNRVRRFRRTVEGLREVVVANNGDMEEFNRIANEVLANAQFITAGEKMLSIEKELGQIRANGIVNARERFEFEEALEQKRFNGLLMDIQDAANKEELIRKYNELKEARRKAFEDNTPLMQMARQWEDVIGNLEEASTGFISNFVDAFVDGIAQGKFAFKDFAKEVLKELLKIIIRGLIAKAIMAAIGAIGGGGGGVSSAELSGSTDSFSAAFAAMGGVIGPGGEMPLKRYARGGIATKPQIAVYGEGDQNEAFVPLPDGRSIPVTMRGGRGSGVPPSVEVNVINETGQPVEAEQGGQRFDGQNFILDVVLKAANRPGNFRDGMQSAMRR